eukprot:15476741-Alexandrium_andersonii.AAC.1
MGRGHWGARARGRAGMPPSASTARAPCARPSALRVAWARASAHGCPLSTRRSLAPEGMTAADR